MSRFILIAAIIAGGLLAVVNNLVNPNGIAWVGSPEVLPKPSGWPSLSLGQGIAAGAMVAWKNAMQNWPWILVLAIIAFGAAWFQKVKRGRSAKPWFLTLLRLLLAWMFLEAAYPKFTDPKEFANLVAQYQFLPAFLVNPFSLWLAAFEIIIGLGLILTPWEREFGTLVLVLMGMFLMALGQALARDLGIACGCFDIAGAADAGETWYSFLRDIVLIFPILALMVAGRRRWLWKLG